MQTQAILKRLPSSERPEQRLIKQSLLIFSFSPPYLTSHAKEQLHASKLPAQTREQTEVMMPETPLQK